MRKDTTYYFTILQPTLQEEDNGRAVIVRPAYFETLPGGLILDTPCQVMQWLESQTADEVHAYINDFYKCAIYFLKVLNDAGFDGVNASRDNVYDNTFFVSMKGGRLQNITYKRDGRLVVLCEARAKFGSNVDADVAGAYLDACYAGAHGWTFASDGFQEWRRAYYGRFAANDDVMRVNFPLLSDELQRDLNIVKKDFARGFIWQKGEGVKEYDTLYEYDQKNAYPSWLCERVPVGQPIFFDREEDVPASYYKLYRVSFRLHPKAGYVDFMPKVMGRALIPEGLFKLIPIHYDVARLEIIEIMAFKTRGGVFIDRNKNGDLRGYLAPLVAEISNPTPLSKIRKLQANALIGRFGRLTSYEYTVFQRDTTGRLCPVTYTREQEPLYLPLHIFVVCEQRAFLIDRVQRNYDAVAYAQTDAIFATQPLPHINRGNFQGDTVGVAGFGKFRLKGTLHGFKGQNMKYTALDDAGNPIIKAAGLHLDRKATPEDIQAAELLNVAYINDFDAFEVFKDTNPYTL